MASCGPMLNKLRSKVKFLRPAKVLSETTSSSLHLICSIRKDVACYTWYFIFLAKWPNLVLLEISDPQAGMDTLIFAKLNGKMKSEGQHFFLELHIECKMLKNCFIQIWKHSPVWNKTSNSTNLNHIMLCFFSFSFLFTWSVNEFSL